MLSPVAQARRGDALWRTGTFDPQTIYFITSRTMQSRFLMAPSDKTNELLGGILARAVSQCAVELFGYVFTSNHFHLMVRAPSAILMSKFMQRLQSNIAVKVGRLVGWRGKFFARRYSAEPIVDDGAQETRLEYILSHGVKEGLVSEVRQWPGLSCAKALLEGAMVSAQTWRNWTRRWHMEVDDDIKIDRFSPACPSEPESLTLKPLPCWAGISASERAERTAQMITKIDAKARDKAEVLGAARIAAQDPQDRPQHATHTPRPKAHASTIELWRAAVDKYRDISRRFGRPRLNGSLDASKYSFRSTVSARRRGVRSAFKNRVRYDLGRVGGLSITAIAPVFGANVCPAEMSPSGLTFSFGD